VATLQSQADGRRHTSESTDFKPHLRVACVNTGVAQAVAARRRVLCNYKMRRVLTQRDTYPVEY
jgi:hypothetical protein